MWDHALDQMLRIMVRHGSLEVHLAGGRILRHGDSTQPHITVRLTDPGLPAKLVRQPDLHLGEAYMNGTLTIDGDDLHGFLGLVIRNATESDPVWWQGILRRARTTLRRLAQFNPAPRALANVAHHYDLSAKLYDLFLDEDRQYSCAYFKHPADSLEQAQAQKKAHIAAKLLLRPGLRVLDIGCGWGGLALGLARDHGVQVLGVTLSAEQHKLATARAERAGLSDRVEFRLADYRSLTGTFDRIVSVGMFEHVGVPHYREYFGQIRQRLAPDGIALVHTIGRNAPPAFTGSFITRYIFPGGYVPALSEMMAALEKETLWSTDIEVWRMHYAQTLRHWHDRFMANINDARALYDDRFCRMWRYYLVASELSFQYGRQCVFQVQLAHRQDAVPLSREYLYAETPRPKRVEALIEAAE